MKKYKKTLLAIATASTFVNAGAAFIIVAEGEYDYVSKQNKINKNITNWLNKGSLFNCSSWTPNESTIDFGLSYQKSQFCDQEQERTKDVYQVYSDGSEKYVKTVTESKIIQEINKKNSIGTNLYRKSEVVGNWTSWLDKNSNYNCDTWTPLASTVSHGDSFEQTRNCSQDQERTREISGLWTDGSIVQESIESETKTIPSVEKRNQIGTLNSKNTIRNGSWSSWANKGIHYNCDTWTPSASTVSYGDSFEQTRDCDQDQERTRNIYDVWLDGTETLKEIEKSERMEKETEKQNEIGTFNFKDTTRSDSWSSWVDKNTHYNCDTWTPLVSTVSYGDAFEQTRDCNQEQTRTRNVYDVWADGAESLKETEIESQVVPREEKQNAIGTLNFKDTTRSDSWSMWTNNGNHYNCEVWTPLTSTVSYGDSFEQTRNCDQNQERTRSIYDVWADGTESLKETETESQVVPREEKQNAIGTKNFKDTTRNGDWSSWADKNSHYDCDSWTPLASTVNYGDSFEQTRNCSQNQERTRNIYDVWADGTESFKETETGSQVVSEEEKQNETGALNFKDTTRNGNWSNWTDKNSHYDCDSWTPLASTINYGDTFEQTRNCSQNQERTRNIYDVWADGTESFKETETGSQVVSEEEKQNSVGTKNLIQTTRNGNWSNWINDGSHYSCGFWTPEASTVNYGDSFEQTRDCVQDQKRTRNIYNVWADGSETFKETETDEQTIFEEEKQNETGTLNFKDTTRNGDWSSWTDKNAHYDCDSWTPLASTVNYGDSFEQTRDCSQDQERTRDIYDVWADGTESLNKVEQESHTITQNESQISVGILNYIASEQLNNWSAWSNVGIAYDCTDWTPSVETINSGESFTQNRDCSQDQENTRDVYDIWADGTTTFNRVETGYNTELINENQEAIGEKVEAQDIIEVRLDPPVASAKLGGSTAVEGNHMAISAHEFDINGVKAVGKVLTYIKSNGNWVQNQVIDSPAGARYGYFGVSTAISGNVMVIGERGENAAHVYRYSGSSWSFETTLRSSEYQESVDQFFGGSVDIDSNKIVVGAKNASKDDIIYAGAVYSFEYKNGSWVETQKIISSAPTKSNNFGQSVAIDNNRIVAGIPNHAFTGVASSGAAEIFEYSDSTWASTGIIGASSPTYDSFGIKVDIENDKVIIGAPYRSMGADYSGAAFVFEYNSGVWEEKNILSPNNPVQYGFFGQDVAISNNKLVVGYPSEGTFIASSGAAYVYEKSGNNWVPLMYKAENPVKNSKYGTSLSIDGNTLVVGADYEDATDGTRRVGAAYIIDLNSASPTTP